MLSVEAFQTTAADPELVIDIHDARFADGVAAVNDYLGRVGMGFFFDAANNAQTDTKSGMKYAVVGGEDASRTAVIPMPGVIANDVYPHMVARAQSIYFAATQGGLRDAAGNPPAVLLMASPGAHSRFGLDESELRSVSHGNYDPVAQRTVRLVERLRFNTVAGYMGWSQASVLAKRFIDNARDTLDTPGNIVLGAPAHAEKRSLFSLGVGVGRELRKFNKEVKSGGIDVINEIFATHQATPDFNKGLRNPENLAMARGFTYGNMEEDAATLLMFGNLTGLLHASNDKIVRRDAVKTAYDNIVERYDQVAYLLRRTEVTGIGHNLGDMLGHLAMCSAGILTSQPQ